MATLRARLVYDVLMPLLGGKRRYHAGMDADTLRANARAPAPPPARPGPVSIEESRCQGHRLYRLRPIDGAPRQRLFYLHGGAFVNPITRYHWNLLTDLCERSRAEILVPLYPLAPETPIDGMLPVIEAIHEGTVGEAPCALLGDSAGAWLALALAQRLRDRARSRTVPALVLISPCLDLTLGDPASPALNRRDPMLDLDGLRRVLALAAAPRPADDPALDPLRAGLAGLPPMLVLAGDRDILYPDGVRLAQAARAAGGTVELLEGPGMAHVWPVLPVPEARAARRAIATFLNEHGDPPSVAG